MYLEQLCHFSPLLFGFCCVLLLHHAEARYGQLELHFELVLEFISTCVGATRSERTTKEDGGGMVPVCFHKVNCKGICLDV